MKKETYEFNCILTLSSTPIQSSTTAQFAARKYPGKGSNSHPSPYSVPYFFDTDWTRSEAQHVNRGHKFQRDLVPCRWTVWYRAERNQLNPKYPLPLLLAPMADRPRPAAPCVRVTFECARINTFRQTLGEIVEQAASRPANSGLDKSKRSIMPESTPKDREVCRGHHQHQVQLHKHAGLSRVPLKQENPTCREARRMKCEKQIQFKRQIISFPPNAVNFPSIDRSGTLAWGSCDHKDQKWPFKNAIWSLGMVGSGE